MSVKEIKTLLDQLGVNRNDCFEKDDLINRLKEIKSGDSAKPPPSSSGGQEKARAKSKPKAENPRSAPSYGDDDDFDPAKY